MAQTKATERPRLSLRVRRGPQKKEEAGQVIGCDERVVRYSLRIPDPRPPNEASLAFFRTIPPSTQPQASLFTKLPLEIREIIYGYALGGHLLSLELVDEPKNAPFRIRCMQWPSSVMAFPMTCHIAYTQSIKYLYTENTFKMDNITTLFCLPGAIAPHLYACLRSIQLDWPNRTHTLYYDSNRDLVPPDDEATWESAWRQIAGMKSLKHVHVCMKARRKISLEARRRLNVFQPFHKNLGTIYSSTNFESLVLEPLMAVKHVEHFHVVVDWDLPDEALRNAMEGSTNERPFDIRRFEDNKSFPGCHYPDCSVGK